MTTTECGYAPHNQRLTAVGGVKRTIRPAKYAARFPAKVGPVAAVSRKPLGYRPSVSIASIIDAVSAETGVDIADIKGTARNQPIVLARNLVSHLAVEHSGKSLPQIGRVLNKHHTTVMYADRRMRERRKSDPEIDGMVARCEMRIRSTKD